MSDLESMLERNKDFAARQSAAGTLMPFASAGAAERKGSHHRLCRYACGSGSCTGN
jgi:hypothetical protein